MKFIGETLAVCFLVGATACGGGGNSKPQNYGLAGNWQITLVRHNSTEPWNFSGFLVETGKSLSGSMILGAGVPCSTESGPITGSIDGSSVKMTIDSLGQDFSLTGSATSASGGSSTMSGQFSTLNGPCLGSSSTGNWSAVQVLPLASPFHGTASYVTQGLNGSPETVVINLSGTMAQGPNAGASNATLTGTFNAASGPQFCPYLTTGSINGLVSGTGVRLTLFGPDGSIAGSVPVQNSPTPATLTLAPDGTPIQMDGIGGLLATSSTCTLQSITVQLLFP